MPRSILNCRQTGKGKDNVRNQLPGQAYPLEHQVPKKTKVFSNAYVSRKEKYKVNRKQKTGYIIKGMKLFSCPIS